MLINQYHLQHHALVEVVIVLDGGLAGCEVAIHLARQNKRVKLVEMNDSLSPETTARPRLPGCRINYSAAAFSAASFAANTRSTVSMTA
ncbi:NAD(P)-binding protein [Klebsiella oxytoca]|uniref:NAD(P)-binding protein n=1 Tax=Klebsiella oxytoca TaxID=571 RepID=UPI000D769648|nr:NAD(P)-binding protein [Klebsiella michiganensis]HCB1845659.1 NAD(P)-binding protein [Klebsiella oxytoca]